jgi:AmiR/NasT family two-component response regulator
MDCFMENIHPNPSRPRILIADDHTIFAEALRDYLGKTFSVVGVVADGRAMLQEALRLKPDVIVADVGIMDAFHLKSNADLVLFGLKRGLISFNPEPAGPRILGFSPVSEHPTLTPE